MQTLQRRNRNKRKKNKHANKNKTSKVDVSAGDEITKVSLVESYII